MEVQNNHYTFCSKKYLNTLWGAPEIWLRDLHIVDSSKRPSRFLIQKLVFGEFQDDLQFPLDFIVEGGKMKREVFEMRYPSAFLIADSVMNLFQESGITGWQPYDVIVRRKNGEEVTGFHGISFTGRNPETPSSDDVAPDFFRLDPGMLYIICSQRVVDLLRKNKMLKAFDVKEINETTNKKIFDCINFPK